MNAILPIAAAPDASDLQQVAAELGAARARIETTFVSVGDWLVGQTWSNFDDLSANPETLDFAQLNAVGFLRQPQIRYTYPTKDAGNFTAAVENSVSYVLDNTGSATTAGTPSARARIAL